MPTQIDRQQIRQAIDHRPSGLQLKGVTVLSNQRGLIVADEIVQKAAVEELAGVVVVVLHQGRLRGGKQAKGLGHANPTGGARHRQGLQAEVVLHPPSGLVGVVGQKSLRQGQRGDRPTRLAIKLTDERRSTLPHISLAANEQGIAGRQGQALRINAALGVGVALGI